MKQLATTVTLYYLKVHGDFHGKKNVALTRPWIQNEVMTITPLVAAFKKKSQDRGKAMKTQRHSVVCEPVVNKDWLRVGRHLLS